MTQPSEQLAAEPSGFRLSPQQNRLWSLREDGDCYVSQCAVIIEGNLRVDELRRILAAITREHEILRTVFLRPASLRVPVQVVTENSELAWNEQDIDSLSSGEQGTFVERALIGSRYPPFDLAKGSLLRAVLLRLSQTKHILIL